MRALSCNASSIMIFTIWVILSTIFVTTLSRAAEMKQNVKRLNVPLTPNVKRLNLSRNDLEKLPAEVHEYAAVELSHGIFLGARATINVWDPKVIKPEVSTSQIWVVSGAGMNINSVEAGVLVDSVSSPTNQNDSYRTGCYDLLCTGFVLTGSKFRPGSLLEPFSTYGGSQRQISIAITKDQVTGNWLLRIENENVGYWPKGLFTSLSSHADKIQWGGDTSENFDPQ
ncbi:uncharacterized protein LOC125315276 [Rhodamnia argentea]|uniref:Uncharacterized protein LOC125315276 n=1 Tax=Rhodamnia argentea TaxID=178133 RepID=A0ABM3HGF3_9MYRT|nr:uncharacterized protein LOC125315276 [Rhodamnia argentea]